MFKNIQKYLLLNHPLLWNTKIVPMIFVLLIVNIIFFALGFNNGEIDFTETNNNYSYNEFEPVLAFIGFLISVIILLIWLVYYFKNNAFKSFYPKNNASLFKEFLIIFSIFFFTSMFSVSYLYATEVRVRNYFSREEVEKRCETLCLGSIFLEGSFESKTYKALDNVGDTIILNYKYAEFKNKRYQLNSLMNKNVEKFQVFNETKHFDLKEKAQNWLFNDDKIAVKSIMKSYLTIANEHRLQSNIDADKWFDLVYNQPDFKEINIIGKAKTVNEYNNYNNYAETVVEDAAAAVGSVGQQYDNFDYVNKFKINKNGTVEEHFKHYVPAANLNYAYEKIADAWISPYITVDKILFPLYFAFGFSLLVFSFRITSGRSWIIALVSLGIIFIFLGVFSALINDEKVFSALILILIVGLFAYFIYVCNKKREKSISGITINAMLWVSTAFVPVLYYIFVEILKWKCN